MTHEQRARRYLQASQAAGYTGLPAEHREAYEAQMAAHERAYPSVREHALAGTDQDFDQPLTAGEREHQAHLRSQDNMTPAARKEIQGSLRGKTPAKRAPRRAAPSSGRSPARRAAAAVAGPLSTGYDVATGKASGQSILMQLIGLLLLLSLVYLLVAGKGVKALGGIAGVIEGGIKSFISPEDPIKTLETALGATPASESGSTSSGGGSAGGAGGYSGEVPSQQGPHGTGAVPNASAPLHGGVASTPAQAARLTPASLQREIKAHKLTLSQVNADLKILYPLAFG